MAAITTSKKIMIRDFYNDMMKLCEKYWVPSTTNAYWDALTDDAMMLIAKYQTVDDATNALVMNTVAAFLNSRE